MPKLRKSKTPGPGLKSEEAPHYGRRAEKRVREKLDSAHSYGGRTETPDPDVNPAKHLHVDEKSKGAARKR